MSAILEARRVSYVGGRRLLVRGVDLSLEPGRVTVAVGPNGAGKSTLLKLLCGELAPTEGAVLVNGREARSLPPWELAHIRAVMPQASDLGFPFTAHEVASLGVEGIGQALSRRDRRRLAEEALAEADVAELAHRNYQTLSGGERQRVHFARVLAQLKVGRSVAQRQILFLDEPTASLDLRHQLALLGHARRLARDGVAVMAVLHDLQLAAETADELVLMHQGRLVARGSPAEVLTPKRLADVFEVRLVPAALPPHPWALAVEDACCVRT